MQEKTDLLILDGSNVIKENKLLTTYQKLRISIDYIATLISAPP